MLKRICSILALLVWVCPVSAETDYKFGVDLKLQSGVPRGSVTKHSWKSEIFPGTVRLAG